MARMSGEVAELVVSAELLDRLEETVSGARQLLSAAACSCALATEDGARLQFVVADGAGAGAIVGVTLPVNRGLAGWAATSGEPIAVADVERDARFARDVAESTDYVPRTVLAAPLMTLDGEVTGVLEVLDPGRSGGESRLGDQVGTGAELSLVTLLASQVASVVTAHRQLDALAAGLGDGLTGADAQQLTRSVAAVAGAGPRAARLATDVLGLVADFVREQR